MGLKPAQMKLERRYTVYVLCKDDNTSAPIVLLASTTTGWWKLLNCR